MGTTVRHYLFPNDQPPRRMSRRLADGLIAGSDAIPEYASTEQRLLTVVIENHDGQPSEIVYAEGTTVHFDADGRIAENLQVAANELMQMALTSPQKGGTVVSIGHERTKRRLAEKYRWQPTKDDLDQVAADIWSTGRAERLKTAKGANARTPSVSHRAKHALEEASEPFWKIGYQIDRLNEHDLKGFAFEARRVAEEGFYPELHRALAELADRRLTLLTRRRSSKGIWYAVAEIIRQDFADRSGEVIATFHKRCEGRKAAVVAARKLMIEHAAHFSDDVVVEVSIETDLEWEDAARDSKGD
jgi:hypothetical protein